MRMARPIDADALRLMKVEECAGHSIEYAMGWKACIEWIKDTPTIDAIPVEWLKKVRKDNRFTIDDVETIDLILTWWQKEQEAR